MKLTIEHCDLFTIPEDYFLCHCISADFALGAGIAKKFAALGVRDALLKEYLGARYLGEIGVCLDTHATKWRGEYNLVTKKRYFDKPTLLSLEQALYHMKTFVDNGDKIAMPRIGCGLDRLNWQEVEQIIREVFADIDIEILVCDWS